MCLIVTIVMFIVSIQHLVYGDYLTGSLTMLVAPTFAFLLIHNIRLAQCDKDGGCDSVCMLPN